jgi:hypothetical protein
LGAYLSFGVNACRIESQSWIYELMFSSKSIETQAITPEYFEICSNQYCGKYYPDYLKKKS